VGPIRQFLSLILAFYFFVAPSITIAEERKVSKKSTQIEKMAEKEISKISCKEYGKKKLLKRGSLLACKALRSEAANSKALIAAAINAITITTFSLSLLNSKCKRTKEGKEFYPKSHTANVTHWIHKLSALIYIYAQVQNTISLRRIGKKVKDIAKSTTGQQEKFLLSLNTKKEELKALKKTKKILKIASLGFGASSAVELGLAATNFVWGEILKVSEIKQCLSSNISLAGCGVIGTTTGQELSRYGSEIVTMGKSCVAQFKTINFAGLAMKEAKSQVANQVVKGIGKLVTPITGMVGGAVTGAIGKGGVGSMAASAGAGFVGSKLSGLLVNQIGTATEKLIGKSKGLTKLNDQASDQKTLAEWKKEPIQCLQKKGAALGKKAVKSIAVAAGVDSCAATLGATCGPAIAANCALQKIINKEGCLCSLRSTKSIYKSLSKISKNFSDIPKTIVKDEKFLQRLAEDVKNDEAINIAGVKDQDSVCSIDRINWGIRHDLECKSILGDKDKETPIDGDEVSLFKSLIKSKESLTVDDLLYSKELKRSFNSSPESKKNNSRIILNQLASALTMLRGSLLADAIAESSDSEGVNDDFQEKSDPDLRSNVDTKSEASLAAGLGLSGIGLLVFPKLMKKMLQYTTVLHRTPVRRGVFFLASFLLAKSAHGSVDASISEVENQIKGLESYMKSKDYSTDDDSFLKDTEQADTFSHLISNFSSLAFASIKAPTQSIPLCVSGTSFSTDCLCSASSSCSFNDINVEPNELMNLKPIYRLIGAKSNYARKIQNNKATKQDTIDYENKLIYLNKELNPIIAANNLTASLKSINIDIDVLSEAKSLVSALNKDSYSILSKEMNMPLKEMNFNDLDISGKELKVSEKQLIPARSKAKSSLKEISKSIIPKPVVVKKSQKKLDDYMVKYSDIHKNREIDLFKVISRRYQMVNMSKKALEE
jgi:hypothetical protein